MRLAVFVEKHWRLLALGILCSVGDMGDNAGQPAGQLNRDS